MVSRKGGGARCSRAVAAAVLTGLLAAGCHNFAAPPVAPAASSFENEPLPVIQSSSAPAPKAPETQPAAEDEQGPGFQDAGQPSGNPYLEELVGQAIAKFAAPGMSEFERAKAAFDYMIENTSVSDPLGLELWRIRGGDGQPLSFVENRALSVLQYGVGMCEDYAAALTLLLRGLGLEARYVPGLTYSAEGHLVDHAWTVAKIDGVWYHLDCQLEDNISRHGAIRYRYFMRGDESLSRSHWWGQRLIDTGLLSADQNAEIAAHFLYEPCPQDYPTPARRTFSDPPAPDPAAIQAEIDSELQAYEALHGPLAPLTLNIIPPVFGLEGYGPADEG